MMAACRPEALNAIARGSIGVGTSSAMSACCAGIWNARASPSSTDTPSSSSRDSQPEPAPPCFANS